MSIKIIYDASKVFLGVFLIFIVLLAMIALANYCFKRLKRRQRMETVGLSDLV